MITGLSDLRTSALKPEYTNFDPPFFSSHPPGNSHTHSYTTMADSENPPGLPEAVVASGEPDDGEKIAEKSPSPAGIPQHRLQAALKTTDILVHRLDKQVSRVILPSPH